MQVSASTFAQRITLSEKNATLSRVFDRISDQTGYDFVFTSDLLRETKLVTINVKNTELKVVLDRIFLDQPVSFSIEDKTVVVTAKAKGIFEGKAESYRAVDVRGKVVDTTGRELPGALVKVKGTDRAVITNDNGEFEINNVQENAVLVITFIGYITSEVAITEVKNAQVKIILKIDIGQLESVNIVSTGYQNLPKERATGSFVQIDNALLNRSVSTNILDRLNGVTSGLIFNTADDITSTSPITIRGRSTLFANADPLIILDNFPYDGDLNNINPNDIESITVLKDAAAASAWGTRSGNGVIVVTTKKGALNLRAKVGFNANVTIGEKPDLYYSPQLSSSEFIDVQKFLYDKGKYTSSINNGYSLLPPAVEIFRNPSDPNYQSKLDALRTYDIRDQLLKYFYQPSVNQQYQANISGGGNAQKYFVSAGFDRNLPSEIGNSYNRITLNASNTYYFLKNRLELFSNIIFTSSQSKNGPTYNFTFPYDQVADVNGNPTTVARDLRLSYAGTAGNGKLLNWLYKPLEELNNGFNTINDNLTDYRINLALSYRILDGLKVSALYNYEKGITNNNWLHEFESYYTRNLINRVTQINATTGAVSYPLPLGDIYYNRNSGIQTHNGRFQVNYDKTWSKHSVSAIAGAEVREFTSDEIYNQFFGYNRETRSNQNASMNFTVDNPLFYGSGTERFFPNTGSGGTTNRFVSYYFNGAYTFNSKYTASVSARQDESNLFGVSTNQKGVPLWSAGLAWTINNEAFYKSGWLPQLKLRATYGYTGNVDNSLSAYLTSEATSQKINPYNSLYATIINPPNPSLRWEKVRNINLGLDFSTKGNRISGSLDLWQKKGIDLIGNSPIAPQTGVVTYKGNSANTLTKGMDIQLNTINLNGKLKWLTTLLYNFSSSKVTDYKVSNGTNLNVVSANYNNPLAGYPYFSIFSFKYAGLNATGAPQGYLNGEVSTNYSGIVNSANRDELVYHGPATPTSFGSLRNTVSYQNFDLSFNISFKLGHYFRRNSLNNSNLYGEISVMADYGNRWQNPGDESQTNVPALIYPANTSRTNLYTYSSVLVEKADNVRLQDIRLGYTFKNRAKNPFKNLNIFTYMNNLGILWRANKLHLDPDYPTGIPLIRTIAFGLRTDL